MGRQRKTTSTTKKHLTKKEKDTRASQEKKIKLDRNDLVVPEILKNDIVAREEFVRIVEAASKIDLWDNLDLTTIVIYCKAWSHYNKLDNQIIEEGYTVQGKESKKINPSITAQDKFVNQIMRCSSKLGLATTDRLKIIVPEPEEKENKFTKYIVV